MTEKKAWKIWETTVDQVAKQIGLLKDDAGVEIAFDEAPLFSKKQLERVEFLESEIRGFVKLGDKEKMVSACEEWGRAHIWAFQNRLNNRRESK